MPAWPCIGAVGLYAGHFGGLRDPARLPETNAPENLLVVGGRPALAARSVLLAVELWRIVTVS